MVRKINWDNQFGRRLKLRDLHVFFTVVQAGSMARAAAQLGVSQPTVSETIADLEDSYGVRLLDRSSRGVEPTIYGMALHRRCVAAFDELKHYADMRIMPSRWPFVLVNRPFRPGISA
jgi:DNA-binding transcriptional LysR family regulator